VDVWFIAHVQWSLSIARSRSGVPRGSTKGTNGLDLKTMVPARAPVKPCRHSGAKRPVKRPVREAVTWARAVRCLRGGGERPEGARKPI